MNRAVLPQCLEVEYWPDTALRVQRLAARPWFAFLDSCRFAPGSGRYDIAAWQPTLCLRTTGEVTSIDAGGTQRQVRDDPFALLRATLGPAMPAGDLPFCGGAIGAFSYDLARRWEVLPAQALRDVELPEMAVGIYDRALVVDHETQRAWFVHRGLGGAEVEQALALISVPRTLTPAVLGPRFMVHSAVSPELSFAQYAAAFARIKTQIRAADIYARDDVDGLARKYGEALAIGLTIKDVQDWPGILDAVTPEDVMAAANEVFDRRQAVTGWLMKDEGVAQ